MSVSCLSSLESVDIQFVCPLIHKYLCDMEMIDFVMCMQTPTTKIKFYLLWNPNQTFLEEQKVKLNSIVYFPCRVIRIR